MWLNNIYIKFALQTLSILYRPKFSNLLMLFQKVWSFHIYTLNRKTPLNLPVGQMSINVTPNTHYDNTCDGAKK